MADQIDEGRSPATVICSLALHFALEQLNTSISLFVFKTQMLSGDKD